MVAGTPDAACSVKNPTPFLGGLKFHPRTLIIGESQILDYLSLDQGRLLPACRLAPDLDRTWKPCGEGLQLSTPGGQDKEKGSTRPTMAGSSPPFIV